MKLFLKFKRKPDEPDPAIEPRLVIPAKTAFSDPLLRRYEQLAETALKTPLPEIEATEEAA